MTLLTVRNGIFKSVQCLMVQGPLNKNIPFMKNCDRQLENKNLILLYEDNFERIIQPKNQVPKSVLGSWITHIQTNRQTHRQTHTHTKVNTEDTLSGFQDVFLQPIITDRSNWSNSFPINNVLKVLKRKLCGLSRWDISNFYPCQHFKDKHNAELQRADSGTKVMV